MADAKRDAREDEAGTAAPRGATAALPAPPAPGLAGISNAALARALRDGGHPGLRDAPAGMPNGAMGRVLARDPVAEAPPETSAEAQLPDPGKHGPHAWDYAFKKKIGDRASLSFKLTFTPTEHKSVADTKVKTEGGGASAGVGFWESKVARENTGGKAATKVSASLLKAGGALETPIPGLKIEAQTKLFEAQVENAKTEAEINAITVAFSIKGDVSGWMSDVAGVPEDERANWSITASGEAKVAPSLADLARIRDMWKAKRQMKASAEAIEAAAKRAEAVHKELKSAQSEIRRLEKELNQFQGYGKRQKKKYPTRKAYEEAKAAKKAQLAQKRAAKAALETEKKALSKTIKTQTKALQKATRTLEKASSGLKSKAGRAMGKVLATQAGKAVARALAKAIPIINIISTLWDLKDIAVALYAIHQGAEVRFGAGGGEGEGEGGEGEGGGGEGGGEAGGGEAEGGGGEGGGEAGGGEAEGGGGEGGGEEGGGESEGGGGEGGGESEGGGGEGGEGGTGPSEGPPAKTEINPNAKAIAEVMKGGTVEFDDEMRRHLDFAVPADLSEEQVAELKKRIQARLGGNVEDPYEIVGIIQEEAERILRGDKPEEEETWVDDERRPDLDGQEGVVDPQEGTPAPTPAPVPTPAPTPTPAPAPAPVKDGKTPAKAEAPKSLMPRLPGVLRWDDTAREFAWKPNGEQFLLDQTFTLGDGLKVGINRATLSNDTQGEMVVATFAFEVMVDELPAGAGADYPWKFGDTRFYSLRFFRNLETGAMGEISDDAATTKAFEDALVLKDGIFKVKRKGATIDTPMATLRVEGISGQSRSEAGDTVIHRVGVLVTPTALKVQDASVLDATGTMIAFAVGKTVTVQLEFAGPSKPKK